ncbi:hypothetical protein ASPCAL02444 [Aspergillus calidoustus]|uniref:Uncharacterized protein n=1 Tax=Aspergillus calidoustus TaxID=454130 RepID=A0A0U5GLP3_ASPCI|nr:hypothetical protein ASPCAL02444 [Aspergillus calidoustus]
MGASGITRRDGNNTAGRPASAQTIPSFPLVLIQSDTAVLNCPPQSWDACKMMSQSQVRVIRFLQEVID